MLDQEFGINTNILETNIINLTVVIGVLIYVGGDVLNSLLKTRKENILKSLTAQALIPAPLVTYSTVLLFSFGFLKGAISREIAPTFLTWKVMFIIRGFTCGSKSFGLASLLGTAN